MQGQSRCVWTPLRSSQQRGLGVWGGATAKWEERGRRESRGRNRGSESGVRGLGIAVVGKEQGERENRGEELADIWQVLDEEGP